MTDKTISCAICKISFPLNEVISGELVRDSLSELIKKDIPTWSAADYICLRDLEKFRQHYVHSLFHPDKSDPAGKKQLEEDVFQSLVSNELISESSDSESDTPRTLGQKLADRIAEFGGSWTFLISFFTFLVLWVLSNIYLFSSNPPDPFPFILLNLLLSCLASVQAPVILMSQNRQAEKDRQRAKNDFKVNLKAELEIRQLHEKLDHILRYQDRKVSRLIEMQTRVLAQLEKDIKNES